MLGNGLIGREGKAGQPGLIRRSAQILAVMCLVASTTVAFSQDAAPGNAPVQPAPAAQAPAVQTPATQAPASETPGVPAASSPQPAPAAATPSAAPTVSPFPADAGAGTGDRLPSATPMGVEAPLDNTVGAAPAATEAPAASSTLPHDLSPWGMFMAADWVVKAVMIGLAFASLITWTVWLAKSLEIAGSKARLAKALRGILGARRLEDASQALGDHAGIGGVLVRAAVEEMEMSGHGLGHGDPAGIKERVESRLIRIQAQAGRRLSRGTGVLATIGSTAPFVGLFGTVWGIMNSFIGISESQTTNLAVVAPGIAEALLATAVGLIAAIPAVVVYNVFARSITGYRQGLADAAAGVQRLVSRDLDRQPQRSQHERPHAVAVAAPANGRHAPAVAV
ncbi:Biopolymer transport protein ExbB [Aminobacter sp. MSH1]|uniref:tonB-system energizer ExbB n=1 Tax=Aminobacter sp. MSH1 TaxID=374606 RepID=UPI000D38F3DA|nr:tonB-system energizer ExbB [Aminobacter sp. MSH1]AWC21194.1 Biopolymer transport protein ExbB [Aminobacter sp. MSH1]